MYFVYFFLTFFLSVIMTGLVYLAMKKLRVVDVAKSKRRKIHKNKIPLGGGLAIFVSFFVVAGMLVSSGDIGIVITPQHIFGLFLGGLVLMVGGFLDDKYVMRPWAQFFFPVLAAVLVIVFGIGSHTVSNPFGGSIALDQWAVSLGSFGNIVLFADILVFFWLMTMMFTTKFLDGLDGLVTGVVTIGALMIFFLSTSAEWYQPEVATLSIVFAGACLGFLLWNWHPAKIFLGEGGSLFTGFLLGSLAIMSGGKIATTLLVVGLPMLDVVRVLIRRIQKKKPVYIGDSEHLHFKLLDSGLSQKQAVLLFYTISLLFGATTLFLQSSEKIVAFLFLLVLMLLLGIWFSKKEGRGKI